MNEKTMRSVGLFILFVPLDSVQAYVCVCVFSIQNSTMWLHAERGAIFIYEALTDLNIPCYASSEVNNGN